MHCLNDLLNGSFPKGNTPQRKDYCYPVTVVKTEPRDLLLEKLRQKQMELTSTLKAAEAMKTDVFDEVTTESKGGEIACFSQRVVLKLLRCCRVN